MIYLLQKFHLFTGVWRERLLFFGNKYYDYEKFSIIIPFFGSMLFSAGFTAKPRAIFATLTDKQDDQSEVPR